MDALSIDKTESIECVRPNWQPQSMDAAQRPNCPNQSLKLSEVLWLPPRQPVYYASVQRWSPTLPPVTIRLTMMVELSSHTVQLSSHTVELSILFLQSSHTVELLIHGLCNFALIERGFKNRDRYLNRVTRLNCRATRSSYRSLFLKSRFIEAKWQNTQGSITEQGGSITRSSYRSARLSYRSTLLAISPR